MATRRLSPSATWGNEKIASFDPNVGTSSVAGSTRTSKRRSIQPAIAARSSGSPGARGYDDTSSTDARSACRMKDGVTSRGSPVPKSIN